MTARQRNNQPETAVAVFDPARAGRELATAVESRRPQLAALLGADLATERGRAMMDRFVTVALHAATSRPDLLKATKESLVESIRDAAMMGLEPVGATGDGSIVVYNEKVRVERPSRSPSAPPGAMVVVEESVATAHFQPMYRGQLKLARRSDQLAHIDAHVVYEGDTIELDLGSSPNVRHFPVLDGTKRGGFVGAYAVAELTNGRRYADWMTTSDIEIVRQKAKAKDAMAWTDFWPEMARKTVLRRLMKRLPLETMAEHALRLENEVEERAIAPAAAVEPTEARSRLRGRFVAPEAAVEPETAPAEDPGAVAFDHPEDVTEGEAREVGQEAEEPPTGEPCGKPSPYGEDRSCTLPAGHSGPHGANEKETWL
jgi:recombinational DNA repair protein RecT